MFLHNLFRENYNDNSHPTTTTSTETAEADGYRPLNVKDALTYLDKVKIQFASQADVYNQFLNIMKDFKSQKIDTPGVIKRVSTLFRGYPELISGFNTFLPPGYRIECDNQDITVTTPSGVIKTTIGKPKEDIQHIEFNQAVHFVNKVKSRFVGQSETYRRFLSILQQYQKNEKPIQQIYNELQVLFEGLNDLLDEFKQFLPEPPKQRKKRVIMPNNSNSSKVSQATPFNSYPLKTKHYHKAEILTSDVRSSPHQQAPLTEKEEQEFFDKVKAHMGDESAYDAFMKVLNLFFVMNREKNMIEQQAVLMNRVKDFIGNDPSLFDWFKTLIGYNNHTQTNKNNKHVNDEQLRYQYEHNYENTDFIVDRTLQDYKGGPSYVLKSNNQQQQCSGRDSLCMEVLNDQYVSRPFWPSEDTGIVAAKKNQYEEALHRVEEERYDYDLNIEANLNTIALLEPIAKKISIMTPEEKASFRLSPGLLAIDNKQQQTSSLTIYQRIMKKIYSTEKGPEMIELLHNNPAQAVPIVLKRLKQKDDEWKRAQREWNKIWREVERKNYWKSLDYQGIQFKMTDRKATTTRFLVTEAEQKQKLLLQKSAMTSEEQDCFFSFDAAFNDKIIFKDMSRLIYFYLDRQPVYNPEDCASMKVFMNTIVPLFFGVTDVEPSVPFSSDEIIHLGDDDDDDDDEDEDDEDDVNKVKLSSPTRRSSTRRGRLNDEDDGLLKDVLTQEYDENDSQQTKQSIIDDNRSEDDLCLNSPKIVTLASLIEKDNKKRKEEEEKAMNEKTQHFFGDNGFYCFFRLYQMLYERLYKMKSLDSEFKKNPEKAKKASVDAHDLGITPRRFKALNMDLKRGYYNVLLSLVDKLFEGEIDQQTFEECVRCIFGGDAYVMFTIDKLVLSIVRHIHIIIADSQSHNLYELFKSQQEHQQDANDLDAYRERVTDIIDSTENTFHIIFNLKSRIMKFRLLLDTDFGLAEQNEEYDEYVSSYINWANETKGIDQALLTPTFLKRYICA
ncbi:MAG: hypothetical protein EXX96DRAFT_492645 [Benjaminiella poitrasii]|nr:MAG: hypothetical protein EXX96DRAFT_492645 [Benjaminiella poitrasii]